MSDLAACSVASNNYLAFAIVFAESYRLHHQGAQIYVCIADRPDPKIDYERLPFHTIFAQDLGIPSFLNFAFRYEILELNTAIKPFLLRFLRDRFQVEKILYFDPDILVCDRLDSLGEALETHQAVLTPHITAPLDNAYDPAERKIRQVGVYNLGFLGLRLDRSTDAFLEWWAERLHRFCLSDPASGLFVDQAWMDFTPAFLDSVLVHRDPTLNVAYWNLPQRFPNHQDGAWLIDRRRVGFFHFSGLDLDDVDTVSRHQTRIGPGGRPELRPLFEDYRNRILAAGHESYRRTPYGFGAFLPGEVEIPWVARRVLQRVDPYGRCFSDPFDASPPSSFLAWLIEPLEFPQGYLNRAVLALWEERPDLNREFKDVGGRDLVPYLSWLRGEQERGELLPQAFLEQVRPKLEASPATGFEPQIVCFDARSMGAAQHLFSSLDPGRPGSLALWLNEPTPGAGFKRPIVTRFMMLLLHMRGDLRREFPNPLDRDQAAFAYWYCRWGAAELGAAAELVDPVRRSLKARTRLSLALKRLGSRRVNRDPEGTIAEAPAAEVGEPLAGSRSAVSGAQDWKPTGPPATDGDSRKGVNLVGSFDELAPRARLTRQSLAALRQGEVPSVAVPLDQDLWGKSAHGRLHQPDGAPYLVTLLQLAPHRTTEALSMLPAVTTVAGYKIGYWFWELAHLPLPLVAELSRLDEIWAPSRFCQRAFESLADRTVRYVPPCVVERQGEGEADRATWKLDRERFYFFAHHDAGSLPGLENPLGAIEVIRRLERRGLESVGLVLQISNAAAQPETVAQLQRKAQGLPVRVHTDRRPGWATVLSLCDALLDLDRAHGLGVLAIEALSREKVVVAPSYGGLTDFLDETTGFPVEFELTRLTHDIGPLPRGSVWAEPDLEHVVEVVATVLDSLPEARRRAAAGRQTVQETYGLEASAGRFRSELERVFGLLA